MRISAVTCVYVKPNTRKKHMCKCSFLHGIMWMISPRPQCCLPCKLHHADAPMPLMMCRSQFSDSPRTQRNDPTSCRFLETEPASCRWDPLVGMPWPNEAHGVPSGAGSACGVGAWFAAPIETFKRCWSRLKESMKNQIIIWGK